MNLACDRSQFPASRMNYTRDRVEFVDESRWRAIKLMISEKW